MDKPIQFETDWRKVKASLEESGKTIEQRVKDITDAKYPTQEMLRTEINI